LHQARAGIDSGHGARHKDNAMNGSEQPGEAESAELVRLRRALASVYKVERLLSRRGTAIVYQGTEINPPRPVALRIFPPELDLGPSAARLRELARVVVALNHPNIVPTYRIGFMAGKPFFVATKLVEGRYLDEVIATQGALHVPLILSVLHATATALAYAHGRNAVHGALTASTILLDRSGNVLVSEFGVARAVEDAAPNAPGTTRLASPEEAAGSAASPWGDQYALGLVALEMLTGSAYAAE
jgi:serine/threonine protein kinase